MSRVTLLMLPCILGPIDDVAYVLDAIEQVKAKHYGVGLRGLHVNVTVVQRFWTPNGSCARAMLRVRVRRLVRGVRHYWCYHTWRWKHKFDLRIEDHGIASSCSLTLSLSRVAK